MTGKLTRFALGIMVVLAVGGIDVLIGQELTAAPLYVVVVGYLAWRDGRVSGVGMALFACGASTLADVLLSEPYLQLTSGFTHPAVPWWNALTRTLIWSSIAVALAALKDGARRREALVEQLQGALAEVRTLQGLLPICAWCKNIRDDEHDGAWLPVEQYVMQKTAAEFTHGICPGCAARAKAEALERMQRQTSN
jgi:hypothetical protein